MHKVKMAVIVADEKVITVCRTREYHAVLQRTLNELVKHQQNILHVDGCRIREKNDHPNYQLKKASTTESNGREKKRKKNNLCSSAVVVKKQQQCVRITMAKHVD